MGNNYNEQAHFFSFNFYPFGKGSIDLQIVSYEKKKLWN